MFLLGIFIALAVTAKSALARQCHNLTVPVTISAQNSVYNLTAPSTNIEVTNLILNINRQGHFYAQEIFTGCATVSGTYKIAATYCAPDNGHGKTIQILTHGGGFDRTYWDLAYNNFNYSYVETAVDEYGFSTLTWDRLGIGESDHPDPILESQATLAEAALKALTDMIHNGTFPGVQHEFEKVVHIGHSIGSILTFSLVRDYPTISDAVVLTSFSPNGTYSSYFSVGANFVSATETPIFADRYSAGYVGSDNPSAIQTDFLGPGQFDPDILPWLVNNTHPNAVGELLSFGGGGINNFTGPVLIITGDRDLPFCGGDCLLTGDPNLPNILSGADQLYPNAKPFETMLVPGGGHGLNLEYGHKQTYEDINKFLQEH